MGLDLGRERPPSDDPRHGSVSATGQEPLISPLPLSPPVVQTLELFGLCSPPHESTGGGGGAVLGFPGLLTALLPLPHKCPKGCSQVGHLVGWDSGWGCPFTRPDDSTGFSANPLSSQGLHQLCVGQQDLWPGALESDILCGPHRGPADNYGFWPVCRRRPDSLPVRG